MTKSQKWGAASFQFHNAVFNQRILHKLLPLILQHYRLYLAIKTPEFLYMNYLVQLELLKLFKYGV